MSITIRLERPEDYRDTEILTREAFWDVCHATLALMPARAAFYLHAKSVPL